MDYFKINIEGQQQFKSSYLLYIVEIINKNTGHYFYIGQTGDRNAITARSAFRRLAGHFSDQGHSRENQVYRQIAEKILKDNNVTKKGVFPPIIKKKVSDFLTNSKVKMHAFPILDFSGSETKLQHKNNRRFLEKIEKEVIKKIMKINGTDRILNKRLLLSDSKPDKNINDIIKKIITKITSS